MTRPAPRGPLALLGALLLLLGLAACAEMRANERPPVSPFFSPGNQAGNRP